MPAFLVVPTRVGMNRSSTSERGHRRCGPHTRGDEPADPDPPAVPQRWSPHAEWRDYQEWSGLVSYAATVGRGLYLRRTRSSTIDHVVRPRSAKVARSAVAVFPSGLDHPLSIASRSSQLSSTTASQPGAARLGSTATWFWT